MPTTFGGEPKKATSHKHVPRIIR
ncbi:hypothetical protein [Staphylococcus aureus]